MKKIRILIACEYSGIVRTAFENEITEVWSCDLLPSEIPGNHYKGNVLDIIEQDWDLLIAHPPCTYLSYAGNASWNFPGREKLRNEAMIFFMRIINAPAKFICVENPRGYVNIAYRSPDQEIHPWYFGECEMKRTGLWLKNLPKLEYRLQPDLFGDKTACKKPEPIQIQVRKKTGKLKKRYRHDGFHNGKLLSGHERSRFWKSIAKAMADQWLPVIIEAKKQKEKEKLAN
jgi:hypothetical protein